MRLDDRTRRIIIPLMLAALCSGCVSSSVDGPAVTYHYSLWWAFCILPAFLSTVPIGLLVRKRNTLYGWLIIAAGAASVVAFAPIAFQESVLVDPGGFHVRSGFWGMTARLDVAIDAVQSIAVVQEDTGGRHSRVIDVLVLTMKDGASARLAVNNDVKVEGTKEILARARTRRIPITP